MRHRSSASRKWALLAVVGLVALQLQVVLAVTATAATFCNGTFNGNPAGVLDMSASRGGSNLPGGASIAAGDTIDLTTTWNVGDWNSLDKVSNCFELNGGDLNALDVQEKPTANDGIFTYSVTVPAPVSSGDTFCVRGDLAGNPSAGGTGTFKSNILCWTVGGTTTNPDVKVTKSANSKNVTSGDTVTFTIEASNVGNATATSVQIKDTVPSGLTITGTSNSCSPPIGQAVTCNVGDIAQSASKSVTITVKVTDAACGSVDNMATVSATNEPAGNTGNNTSDPVTLNVSCPQPDVKVTKSANKTSVNSGDSFRFTITASNVGGSTANNVTITDTIPNGLTITGASATCGWGVGQKVTCNVGDIAAGGSTSITIDVRATDASCPEWSNVASVSAANEPAGNTGNNSSSPVKVTVVCPNPDVSIRKSADAPNGGVQPGDSFTYTITVNSVGGATANNVVVSDTIPAGLTITGTSNTCSVNGQSVTCALGNLAGGDHASVTITVKATDGACPEVDNHATVTSSNEPAANTGNNTSNHVTTIVNCIEPGIAIKIVKTNDANRDGTYTDNEEARRSGLDVPFKLVIINTGTPDLRITDLTDAFGQTTLDLLNDKCPGLSGKVLSSGESVTCTFTLNNYSPPATSGGLVNTAEVCGENMTGDKTDCDNDASKVRSAEVLGKTITPTPPGGTAFTGSDDAIGFGSVALLLLMLGSGLTYLGYRRRARFDG